jgi:hypothetical protein
MQHPRAWIDMGTPCIRRGDPSRDIGKFSWRSDPPLISSVLPVCIVDVFFVQGRHSQRLVGGEHARSASSARRGLSWRCSWW